jgi:hypothetical protein
LIGPSENIVIRSGFGVDVGEGAEDRPPQFTKIRPAIANMITDFIRLLSFRHPQGFLIDPALMQLNQGCIKTPSTIKADNLV